MGVCEGVERLECVPQVSLDQRYVRAAAYAVGPAAAVHTTCDTLAAFPLPTPPHVPYSTLRLLASSEPAWKLSNHCCCTVVVCDAAAKAGWRRLRCLPRVGHRVRCGGHIAPGFRMCSQRSQPVTNACVDKHAVAHTGPSGATAWVPRLLNVVRGLSIACSLPGW